MSFNKFDEKGVSVRRSVGIDFSDEVLLTEQSHKKEVDINQIIKRHGMDLIQKTNLLMSESFRFDDVTGNDFQEAMLKVSAAKTHFEKLPSEIRAKFDFSAAKFLDFVQNPANNKAMQDLGLLPADPAPADPVDPAPASAPADPAPAPADPADPSPADPV